MTERLLEAAQRGLWANPEHGTLDELREELLAIEGALEDRTGDALATSTDAAVENAAGETLVAS